MRLFLLFLFLFYAASANTENLSQTPAHHLSDGTYANTNGVPYESSFKKLMQWSWERRSKDLSTFKFEMEKPNYKEIYNNNNIVTTWIGHETFLYQNKDINVLTDPHFTDRASPLSFAGPKRYMPPGMEIEDLPNIDVVTISHSHYDHLGGHNDYEKLLRHQCLVNLQFPCRVAYISLVQQNLMVRLDQ